MNATLKKPTNLSVRTDLLEEARALGINLSQTLETALDAAEVKKHRKTNGLSKTVKPSPPTIATLNRCPKRFAIHLSTSIIPLARPEAIELCLSCD
jgi:post-segregation antitoxin (ccd killing protein)